jgi:hypothetical protein
MSRIFHFFRSWTPISNFCGAPQAWQTWVAKCMRRPRLAFSGPRVRCIAGLGATTST